MTDSSTAVVTAGHLRVGLVRNRGSAKCRTRTLQRPRPSVAHLSTRPTRAQARVTSRSGWHRPASWAPAFDPVPAERERPSQEAMPRTDGHTTTPGPRLSIRQQCHVSDSGKASCREQTGDRQRCSTDAQVSARGGCPQQPRGLRPLQNRGASTSGGGGEPTIGQVWIRGLGREWRFQLRLGGPPFVRASRRARKRLPPRLYDARHAALSP